MDQGLELRGMWCGRGGARSKQDAVVFAIANEVAMVMSRAAVRAACLRLMLAPPPPQRKADARPTTHNCIRVRVPVGRAAPQDLLELLMCVTKTSISSIKRNATSASGITGENVYTPTVTLIWTGTSCAIATRRTDFCGNLLGLGVG